VGEQTRGSGSGSGSARNAKHHDIRVLIFTVAVIGFNGFNLLDTFTGRVINN